MSAHEHASYDQSGADAVPTAIDPVCGMTVKLNAGKPSLSYKGEDLPLLQSEVPRPVRGGSVVSTCPATSKKKKKAGTGKGALHLPDGPGDRAGRAGDVPDLRHGSGAHERRRATSPNHELIDFTRRRLWVSAGAAIPLLLLTMGPMVGLPVRAMDRGAEFAVWLEFLLATPVVLWAARPFFHRGWTSISDTQLQHVDADHARRRGGLRLFSVDGHLPAGPVSR
jgi:Cu+-exporting ATPase